MAVGRIAARLARLERRMGLASVGEERPAGIVVVYKPGQPAPALTASQRLSVDRGAAVFWMPDNGREAPPAAPRAAQR